jgi:hypoxanthine phosphoribosyltransferase
MDKHHVDYQQYHDLVGQVIAKVQRSGFQPDVVLGVARGGLLLADGLSRALKVPMAVVVASSYQDSGGMVQGRLRVSASVASLDPVRGKVLLVDDLADSGKTLLALREHLEQTLEGLQALKTAVIWVKPHSVIEPDYSALHLKNDVWIVQPFEIRDF